MTTELLQKANELSKEIAFCKDKINCYKEDRQRLAISTSVRYAIIKAYSAQIKELKAEYAALVNDGDGNGEVESEGGGDNAEETV